MSLIQAVVALIEEAGQGTTATIAPDCPDATPLQVQRALLNAAANGQIHAAGRVPQKGGTRLTLYKPGPGYPLVEAAAPPRVRVSSVFEWARACQ